MQITINAPNVLCLKCGETAPLVPTHLRLQAPITPAQPEGFGATDDAGREWRVMSATKPPGWVLSDGDDKRGLCPACADKWAELTREFLPPPVEESAPLPTLSLKPAEPIVKHQTPLPPPANPAHTMGIPQKAAPAASIPIPAAPSRSTPPPTVSSPVIRVQSGNVSAPAPIPSGPEKSNR